MKDLTIIDDSPGLSDVSGFELAGVSCDVRNKGDDRLDMALIFSQFPCKAAGVFTLNKVKAAPVRLCEDYLRAGGDINGIIANSGNANACTGEEGLANASEMAKETASACGVPQESIFVCSTGRIGEQLPMDKIKEGISSAAQHKNSSDEQSQKAANAILTSDTCPKTVTVQISCNEKTVTISGMAKGAGMIEPNMATMLAFLATDLDVSSEILDRILRQSIKGSFNAITIDGDMSTNDTVLLLANGSSGQVVEDEPTSELYQKFEAAVEMVCQSLAEKVVSDGEKITKVVELNVSGAASPSDAEKVARAIGNSLLVKSSWYGEDPNWGRLAHAAGYAGADLIEEKLDISYDDVPVLVGGMPKPEYKTEWKEIVRAKRFTISLNLNLGEGKFRLLATDLTEGYVNFNKSE